MKTLSNANHLMVLCQLAEGDRSVGELADTFNIRMPAMSQQFNLLRLEGIVTSRRDGQTIYHSLARDDVKKLITFLYETYCNPSS
jgi:DNA-binding transcriptional ArsR family regulator